MKKLYMIIFVSIIFTALLAGCNSQQSNNNNVNPGNETQGSDIPTETDTANLVSTEFFRFDNTTGTILGLNESAGAVTDIIIPSEIEGFVVRIIAANAFNEKGLNSVVLPDKLEKIEEYAFADNNISTILFPDTLSVIESGAFLKNKLTELTLPRNITEIDVQSFSDNLIARLNLPDSLTIVRRSAFRTNKITELDLPKSLLTIESNAFQDNLIKNLVFNDGLERIDGYAFDSNKLVSITIPASVKMIGYATEGATPVKYFERFTFAYNNLVSITILSGGIDINTFVLTDNNYFKNAYESFGAGTYKGTQIGKWEKVE